MAELLRQVRCGIVGYGPAFKMGKHHADFINACTGMKVVAVCDPVAECRATAEEDLPGVHTYADLSNMLADEDFDLAILIVPHNMHSKLAVDCMKAGKHVVVEKPMCISAAEARKMLQAAKTNDVMLSVFHNRRWDADFLTIQKIIGDGLIGNVFDVEAYMGGWEPPRNWWRSDKKISGGAFFDWGAHILDWTLQIVNKPIIDVTGFFHKRVWTQMTNEDQVRAIIRFEDNVQADVKISSIARVRKAKWRILGEKGAIEAQWSADSVKVVTELNGLEATLDVPLLPSTREKYYENIAAHLRKGTELVVKPIEAATVIAVMDAAEKSAAAGRPQKIKL